MATIRVKPKNDEDVEKKPRVWFTCHPDDFNACFEVVCKDIFKTHDCAIYYTEDMSEAMTNDQKKLDLDRSNLFVVPITKKLLTTSNRAMDEDIPYALEKHIPVLPILREAVDDEVYSSRFGELQYLNPLSDDQTEIPYDEKLKKYLESVLISKKLADRIRHAFYAYIFLSYRKVDRAYANTLMRLIHSIPDCRDFAIWFDEFLTPGESFKANIEKALDDCKLFTLLVTERLFKKNVNENGEEVDNFVIANELPMAKDKRNEKGTEIFAVEMEDVGEEVPSRLEADEYIRYDDAEFRERLLAAISKIPYDVVDTPEHAFLIGLAYLEGIDMEVDRERAVELITSAADEDLAEAMEKLIRMHKDGVGVARDAKAVQKWSKRLAEHYFKRIFAADKTIVSEETLFELFSHYADDYFAETIKAFLVYADEQLTGDGIKTLYTLLMQQGICEYTLFFEACQEMQTHREEAQCALLWDILRKSADGIYPPYGPLFWYVPEYALYEQLLLTLNGMTDERCFTKALALTRDVCWIFGRFNTVAEITDRVNGEALFVSAVECHQLRNFLTGQRLRGVRRGLCELFFTGDTAEKVGANVYPRCFNIAEAMHWKGHGQGVFGRMPTAFKDELGLYSHEMFSELGGEYIGVIAAPYDRERLETVLPQKSCKKLCGLFLSPTRETRIARIAINDSHVRVGYVPENAGEIMYFQYLQQPVRTPVRLANGLLYIHDSVAIPEGVTEIEQESFADYVNIRSVSIPDSVTKIAWSAFRSCSSLMTIDLPNSVTEIGGWAFAHCGLLSTIKLPKNLITLAIGAFEQCVSLTSADIPEGVTEIGSKAFEGCRSLASVTFSNGLTCIGHAAFKGCVSLRPERFPKSVTHIGSQAFCDCSLIESVEIPDGVTKIENGVFDGCTSLESVYFRGNITGIGQRAFAKCVSLKMCHIPHGVTEIEPSTFNGCESLETITIDDGVTVIGDYAFHKCTALTVVTLPKCLITIGKGAFMGCTMLEPMAIPDSVTTIREIAFADCMQFTSIRLPDSLSGMGMFVFSGCKRLRHVSNCYPGYTAFGLGVPEDCELECRNGVEKEIVTIPQGTTEIAAEEYRGRRLLWDVLLPDGVTVIGERSFENCASLFHIRLPDGLIRIGANAFSGCGSLKSIDIPNSVTEIGEGAFKNCFEIPCVTVPRGITTLAPNTFKDCKSLEYVQILSDMTAIGESAFEGCKVLPYVDLPDTVTEMGESAFGGCESLETMNIPNGVKRIGNSSFIRCRSLVSICIPETVTEIGNFAFSGCRSLVLNSLPDSVKKIGWYAFEECHSLTLKHVPDGVPIIGTKTFFKCTSLTSISIPSSVKTIEESSFAECTSLATVVLSDGTLVIKKNAFKGCVSLTSILLPASVCVVEEDAFAGCTGLKEITISRRFEDDLERIFRGVDLSQVTIHWLR